MIGEDLLTLTLYFFFVRDDSTFKDVLSLWR